MSEISSPAAEPSYVSRLALRASPFNEAVDSEIFYRGQTVEQSLNLTQHLLSSSDRVILIHAAAGLGKTCLLAQLQKNAADNLRLVLIQGNYQPDISTALLQCLKGFGVDDNEIRASSSPEALLKTRLAQLRELALNPVILLDDADKLSPDVLQMVFSWHDWKQDDSYLLQSVICCQKAVSSISTVIQNRLQKVDLQPLMQTEVEPYLLTRLKSVGFQGESPFNSKEIAQLYKQSQGNPGALNKLAHQKLLGVSVANLKPAVKLSLNFQHLFRLVAASIIVVAIVTLLWFQDQINALFETKKEVDEQTIIELSEQAEELATVVVEDKSEKSHEEASREELADLLAELDEPADPQPELQQPEVEVQPTIVEEKIENTVPKILAPQSSTTSIHQQDWILKQRTTNYTFQLMGTWDHKELEEFIDKYALTGDVAEFESLRNGRTWYVLIYGVYSSKQAAISASKSWPAPLNTLPSWLRRFDSVQKQINSKS